MPPLVIAGDVLWILALSIMSSASLNAWKRVKPDARVPMEFGSGGSPRLRARPTIAFATLPVAALLVGILLVVANRHAPPGGEAAVIYFGIRATFAAMFAITDLRWLRAALEFLEQEGALKP